jgi:peptidoglycan biosynthesis protein MviN/MurJ (putative lipid II flippase)
MNEELHDGTGRQRWSLAYAISLSTFLALTVLLATELIGMTGRGWQVAIIVQIVFAIIAMLFAAMAAESLAWRLRKRTRWIVFGITWVLGVGILAKMGSELLTRPGYCSARDTPLLCNIVRLRL